MPVPYADLRAVNDHLVDDILEDLREVFTSGQFGPGPVTQKFEEAWARFIGCKHCVSVNSGADAILLCLNALGIGPGDEVLCSAFSHPSIGQVIARLGATPIFVDCRPDTFNMDPEAAVASITSRTKALVATHLFGQAAEIERLVSAARTYSVSVVEDCTMSAGARIHGRRLGTYGNFGCYSFDPERPLGSAGDAGAITTNDDNLVEVLRKQREFGSSNGLQFDFVGYLSRLDAVQAAVLLRKISELDDNNQERIANARRYTQLFEGTPVVAPRADEDLTHVFSSYVVLVPERERLIERLTEKGIGYQIPVMLPMHLQPCFLYLGYKEGAFPVAEDLAKRCLALPVAPGMKKKDVQEVASTVLAYYGAATA